MSRKEISTGILLVCLVAIVTAAWPVRVVTVTLPREKNHQMVSLRVRVGDTIELNYRHSVELTRVVGIFAIGPDASILARETRMESVGTGLPNAFPERTRRQDGWIVVDEKNRAVGPIRFYYVPINRTRLKIAGQSIDLTKLHTGALIQIAVYKRRLISFWR